MEMTPEIRSQAVLAKPHRTERTRSSSPCTALNEALFGASSNKRGFEAVLENAIEEVESMVNFGVAVGVKSVHCEQRLLPLCLKIEPTCAESVAFEHTSSVVLLFDLSGSMRKGTPTSGIDGLLETLDCLPSFFTSKPNTKLTIMAFSSSCGGLEHNHSKRGEATTTLTTSVDCNDQTGVEVFCKEWAEKCKRVSLPALDPLRECGGETNYEEALRAAFTVIKGNNSKNVHVYLCTDGDANAGHTTKLQLRRIINEEAIQTPVSVHALMIGSGAVPHLLAGLLNGRGMLAYASVNSDLSNGVVDLLEKTLAVNTTDAVIFVEGTMTNVSLGTIATSGIVVAQMPTIEEATKEVNIEVFFGTNVRQNEASVEATKAALIKRVEEGNCEFEKFSVPVDNSRFWLPDEYQGDPCFTTSKGVVVWSHGHVRVTSGLFEEVHAKEAFLASCEEALGSVRTHEDSIKISRQMATRATRHGYTEVAVRCDAVSKQSEGAHDTAKSASHFALSQFSQW